MDKKLTEGEKSAIKLFKLMKEVNPKISDKKLLKSMVNSPLTTKEQKEWAQGALKFKFLMSL